MLLSTSLNSNLLNVSKNAETNRSYLRREEAASDLKYLQSVSVVM